MVFAGALPEEVVKRKSDLKKEPIDPTRIRKIPREGFSWIERRFVRDGFAARLPLEAILLYFFLAAVSDAEGLSFYADPTIGRILKLDPEELSQARARLTDAGLILYRYPLYQVLPIPRAATATQSFSSSRRSGSRHGRGGEPISLGEILKLAQDTRKGEE